MYDRDVAALYWEACRQIELLKAEKHGAQRDAELEKVRSDTALLKLAEAQARIAQLEKSIGSYQIGAANMAPVLQKQQDRIEALETLLQNLIKPCRVLLATPVERQDLVKQIKDAVNAALAAQPEPKHVTLTHLVRDVEKPAITDTQRLDYVSRQKVSEYTSGMFRPVTVDYWWWRIASSEHDDLRAAIDAAMKESDHAAK